MGIINIYDRDTERLVASVHLNEIVSRRIRKLILEEWDNIGEYDLDPLIYNHDLSLYFLYFDTEKYSYTFEMKLNEQGL